ncbi:MAG: hypothetical protein QW137_01860, partial [Candidatus Caldarchaeum sp.]
MRRIGLARGPELFLYSFPEPHPLNRIRLEAFYQKIDSEGKELQGLLFVEPEKAGKGDVTLFHTPSYVEFVEERCRVGRGYLDYGDTPAFPGCFEA